VYSEGPDTKRAAELRLKHFKRWDADVLLELLKEEFGETGRPDIYPGLDTGKKAKSPHR
jgi:hypothetical protein